MANCTSCNFGCTPCDFGLDFGLGLEMNDLEPYAVIAIAAVLGMAPRVMKEFEIIHQGAAISLATLVVSLVLAEGVSMYMDSNFLGLIFFIVMFGGYLLDSNGRHEWNTVMIFGITGLGPLSLQQHTLLIHKPNFTHWMDKSTSEHLRGRRQLDLSS